MIGRDPICDDFVDGGQAYPSVEIITGGGGCFPINRKLGMGSGGPCSLVVML